MLKSKHIYPLSLSAISAIFFALFYIYPPLLDDVSFSAEMDAFRAHPSLSSFFSSWFASVKYHYLFDNGRIAQLIVQPLLVAPKWISAAFLAICTAAALYLSAKIICVWKKNIVVFSLILLLWAVAMPWMDYMFGVDYALNYLLTTVLLLLVLYLFLHSRVPASPWAFVIGLISGASHEICGCALIAGLCVGLFFYQRYRTSRNFALLLGVIAGVAYLVFSPGAFNRSEGYQFDFSTILNLRKGILYSFPVVSAALLYIFAYLIKKVRPHLDQAFFVPLFATTLCSWAIWRVFMNCGLRTLWFTMSLAILANLYTLSRLKPTFQFTSKSTLFAAPLLALAFFQPLLCIPWFNKLNIEVSEARNLMKRANGADVFYRFTSSADAPAYILGKPNFNVYSSLYSDLRDILPPELENFDDTELEDFGGLVIPFCHFNDELLSASLLDINGHQLDIQVRPVACHSATGVKYLYLKPLYIPIKHAQCGIASLKLN